MPFADARGDKIGEEADAVDDHEQAAQDLSQVQPAASGSGISVQRRAFFSSSDRVKSMDFGELNSMRPTRDCRAACLSWFLPYVSLVGGLL